jgi:hypothetical protein
MISIAKFILSESLPLIYTQNSACIRTLDSGRFVNFMTRPPPPIRPACLPDSSPFPYARSRSFSLVHHFAVRARSFSLFILSLCVPAHFLWCIILLCVPAHFLWCIILLRAPAHFPPFIRPS